MREIVEKQRPFQKNEELVITIEDMTNEGEGIGRANGYALFVKNTLPGEVVKVRIMKAKKIMGMPDWWN